MNPKKKKDGKEDAKTDSQSMTENINYTRYKTHKMFNIADGEVKDRYFKRNCDFVYTEKVSKDKKSERDWKPKYLELKVESYDRKD
jgi:hypothetical protein